MGNTINTNNENEKVTKEFDSLTQEMFEELKLITKRNFILIIILIVALFITNIVWAGVMCFPSELKTESYELTGENDSNVIYNDTGKVHIGE